MAGRRRPVHWTKGAASDKAIGKPFLMRESKWDALQKAKAIGIDTTKYTRLTPKFKVIKDLRAAREKFFKSILEKKYPSRAEIEKDWNLYFAVVKGEAVNPGSKEWSLMKAVRDKFAEARVEIYLRDRR